MSDIIMTPAELEQITGYKAGTKQLEVLHRRGFNRAYIGRRGVVLERAHYDAVCCGTFASPQEERGPAANLEFLRARKRA